MLFKFSSSIPLATEQPALKIILLFLNFCVKYYTIPVIVTFASIVFVAFVDTLFATIMFGYDVMFLLDLFLLLY